MLISILMAHVINGSVELTKSYKCKEVLIVSTSNYKLRVYCLLKKENPKPTLPITAMHDDNSSTNEEMASSGNHVVVVWMVQSGMM